MPAVHYNPTNIYARVFTWAPQMPSGSSPRVLAAWLKVPSGDTDGGYDGDLVQLKFAVLNTDAGNTSGTTGEPGLVIDQVSGASRGGALVVKWARTNSTAVTYGNWYYCVLTLTSTWTVNARFFADDTNMTKVADLTQSWSPLSDIGARYPILSNGFDGVNTYITGAKAFYGATLDDAACRAQGATRAFVTPPSGATVHGIWQLTSHTSLVDSNGSNNLTTVSSGSASLTTVQDEPAKLSASPAQTATGQVKSLAATGVAPTLVRGAGSRTSLVRSVASTANAPTLVRGLVSRTGQVKSAAVSAPLVTVTEYPGEELTPDSLLGSAGATITGGGTIYAALADRSESTYVSLSDARSSVATTLTDSMFVPSPTGVRMRIRAKLGS